MQINTRKDKVHLCEIALETTNKLAKAIEEIKNGESETKVCCKYNLKKRYIRHYIFNNNNIFNNNEEKVATCGQEILLSGGEKLYKKIEPGKRIPYDVNEIIEHCLKNSNLRKNDIKMLRMRYWEDMTLEEIGEHMGLTRERIRQKEVSAIHKIRRKCHGIIKYGSSPFIKQRNEKLEKYIKEKEEELLKYNNLVKKASQLENEIELLKEENKDLLTKEQLLENETVGDFFEYCLKNENISIRLYNCFNRRKDCSSFKWKSDRLIKDMAKYTKKEIINQVRNLGRKSIDELEYLLSKRGICFKEEEEE